MKHWTQMIARCVLPLALLAVPLLAFADDKSDGQPAASENPPPKVTLNKFKRFEMEPIALGAAYSLGGTDKAMLIRLSNMVTEYLRNNYSQAVGGSVSVAPKGEVKGDEKE